jgi:hypothetical protein
MSKRNGSLKVVQVQKYPLMAGAFICDVHSKIEAEQRECDLLEQLGLSESEYERCSDWRRVLNVIKHRVQKMLEHASTRKQWQQLQNDSKKSACYYNQAALYLELLLLVCHRGPGLHYFDQLSQEVFAVAGTEKTETLQSGIAHAMVA